MSKGNIFISVITLLLLAPLCRSADVVGVTSGMSLEKKTAEIWANILKKRVKKQGTLTQGQIVSIQGRDKVYVELMAKAYYFLVNEKRDQLPEWLQDSFKGVSLRDLRERNKVPAIEIWGGKDCWISARRIL